MNRLFALFILLSFLAPVSALAQKNGEEGEILSAPICTDLINRSTQTIMGTVSTAPQTLPSGDNVRHRNNFRLEAGQKQKICAAGPFFEGRRVEVMIRTLIPLFSCKTKLEKEIFLDATPQEDGTTKLTATCT